MKVVNAFAQLFAIFAFLTLGSLLIIISLHLLSYADASIKLQEIYQNPWRSMQIGVVGLVFILMGLAFSKMLVKMGRPNEALIYQSEVGPMVVSSQAIESAAFKALKKFSLVKKTKIKINIRGKDVEVKLRLILWSGGQVPSLLSELQEDVQARVKRLLGPENQVIVTCDVKGIEETETLFEPPEVEKEYN